MNSIKNHIKKLVNSTGFPLVRFTDGMVSLDHKEHYRNWIKLNYHADMNYLERDIEKRFDPTYLFPEYQSMVVLGFPYQQEIAPGLGEYISIYAYGRDYHKLLKQKMKQISKQLLQQYNIKSRGVVDSAPILERYYAEKSGLGWRGKNGLIINQKFGSTFFIALLLIDQNLEPDPPVPNRCGSCKQCIQSCPPQAIIAPGIIDSRKCLSYWTIEAKKHPPSDIEQYLHATVFGCDRCQSSCPWTQKAAKKAAKKNAIKEPDLCYRYQDLSLEYLASIDEATFLELFAGSPIRRGGYLSFIQGIKRVIKYRNCKTGDHV